MLSFGETAQVALFTNRSKRHLMSPTYIYVDENSVDEELLCSDICYQPLVDPMAHNTCRHSFCRSCIQKVSWKCPNCRAGTESDYSEVNVRVVLNQLSRIPVICTSCNKQMQRGEFNSHKCESQCSRGCGTTVESTDIREHELICPNMPVQCKAKDLGCTETPLRGVLLVHQQECKYEQSRWIVEQLNRKYDTLNNKYNTLENQYNKMENMFAEVLRRLNTLELNKTSVVLTQTPTPMQPSVTIQPPTPQVRNTSKRIDTIACGSYGKNRIQLWNIATATFLKFIVTPCGTRCMIQLYDGALAVAHEDHIVRIWNISTNTCTQTLFGHTGSINCIIQLTNESIATGSEDKRILLWKTTGECTHIINVGASVRCLLQLREGPLVCGTQDNYIHFYDYATGTKIKLLQGHTDAVTSLVQLQDGRLVSGSWDKTVMVWQGSTARSFKGYNTHVSSIIMLSDGRLASCSGASPEFSIRICNIKGDCEVETLRGHTNWVHSIMQVNDTIVSGSEDTTVRVWKGGRCIKQLDCFGRVSSVVAIQM